jgi:cysteinyl-tRNA synthetase
LHPPRPLFLMNTFGRQMEEFQPLEPGHVKMYTCGPTVYSYAHIGNFRAYIFADILRRTLEYNGYEVTQVRNITDVGHLTNDTLNTGVDKMEAAARSQNASPWDIAKHITDVFLVDATSLNIKSPEYMPRATEYIDTMIDLIEVLVNRGYAYPANGDVYFDVTRFPNYGALSGNTIDDLIGGHRVEVGEGKKSPGDFSVWRSADPDKIMRWDSPWGTGVPGWHLECSAMAIDLLGPELDIHTGGEDHIFPHHEDEIAQSEAATGRRFSHFWLHNGWLQIGNDEKMSKSLGNIYTLKDVAGRGIHPLSFRYFTLQAHYRTPLSFSWEALNAAQTGLYRLWEAVAELGQVDEPRERTSDSDSFLEGFHEAINRDLDTSVALSVLHAVVGSQLSAQEKQILCGDFDRVLGLDLLAMGRRLSETTEDERRLLSEREAARSSKDFAQSDALRDQLRANGVDVKDTPTGQRTIRRDVLPAFRNDDGQDDSG